MPVDRADGRSSGLHGEIRSPTVLDGRESRAGELLRAVAAPRDPYVAATRALCHRRPGCHELRIVDVRVSWRIVYHVRLDAVVILAVFAKKTRRTPLRQIEASRDRLRRYFKDIGEG